MLGTLLTPDKSTITNLICTHGGQDRDWTADYRLYSKDRVEESHLFDQAREPLLENLAPNEALVVALDDTIVRKTGKKIHGSGCAFLRPPKWRKDHRETGRPPSTGDLLRLLRAEIWVRALNPGSFDHFATAPPPDTSAQKPAPDLSATLFAAA